MVCFRFKLYRTERISVYDIPDHWEIKHAFTRIKDYISKDFSLQKSFEMVCMDNISSYYTGTIDDCHTIDCNNMVGSVLENYGYRDVNSFYITQKNS